MTKKDITINELAKMINKSFDKVATREQVEGFEKWTKEKINKIEKDVSEIKILVTNPTSN